MFPYDAFRVAGLKRGFAHRTVFGHKHGNERAPHHIVRETKFFRYA
jgi:hypothetical protein